MVRALSVAVAVVLAVVAMAVPALAALVLLPGLWLPSLIEARLGSRLDRDVVVAGPASLDLFGGPPAVVVGDLHIANPPWAEEPWFLRAERARVELRWAALRRLSLDPTLLALEAPRVHLVRARSGGTTWPRVDGGASGGGLDLNRLRVTDGRALYHDPESDTRLEAAVETRDGRLAVQADGRWRGQPLSATALGGAPMQALRAGEGYPLRLQLTSGDLRLMADGTVVGLPNVRGVDLRLSGQGPSLAEVGRLIGVAFPSSPPFDLIGRLRGQGQTWSYGDAIGTIGHSDVTGGVEVRGGTTPHIEIDLVSDHLRVGDALAVAGFGGGMPAEGAGGGGRVIPDVPLPSGGLTDFTLRLKLRAREAVGGPLPLGELVVHASITEGKLTVEPVEATLPDGGQVAARFALDTAPGQPQADLRATFQNVAFTVPLPEEGEGASGTFSGRLDLSGSGDSLRGMLAVARGEAALLVPRGRLSSAVLGQTGVGLSDLLGLFVPTGDGGRTVALHCAAATATVTDGIAQVPGLVLDTDTARLEGRGSLDLAAETMDMVVRIDPAEPQLLSFSGPVHVTGPWTAPNIDPQVGQTLLRGLASIGLGLAAGPLAALVPLVDLGQTEEQGCGDVLRGAPSTSEAP